MTHSKQHSVFFLFWVLYFGSFSGIQAATLELKFQLPQITSSQYQRPFVAVWIEKKGERKAWQTAAVWFNDPKWLKDLRRWWRKGGRYISDQNIDAITSATKPAGEYQMTIDLPEHRFNDGSYTLYLESVREHGNRTLLKQPFVLGTETTKQQFVLDKGLEIGPVDITLVE